jgi:hypothetical protein
MRANSSEHDILSKDELNGSPLETLFQDGRSGHAALGDGERHHFEDCSEADNHHEVTHVTA